MLFTDKRNNLLRTVIFPVIQSLRKSSHKKLLYCEVYLVKDARTNKFVLIDVVDKTIVIRKCELLYKQFIATRNDTTSVRQSKYFSATTRTNGSVNTSVVSQNDEI